MTRGGTILDWSAIPVCDGKVWGPDLFAWAYDLLASSGLWRDQRRPGTIASDPLVQDWIGPLRAGYGWVLPDVVRSVQASSTHRRPGYVLLRLLVALDRAYHGMSIVRPQITPELEQLEELWLRTGSLGRAVGGSVLRKGTSWQQGAALAQYCENLARVRADQGLGFKAVPHCPPWRVGSLLGRRSRGREIRVAFVPMLYECTDVEFTPHGSDGFRLTLDSGKQRLLSAEMPRIVAELETERVNVALLPEACASSDVVAALRAAMRSNFSDALAAGRMPELRLVAVGEVASSGTNAAVLLDAAGDPLFRQRKVAPWYLNADQQRRYGMSALSPFVDRHESVLGASALNCLDDPGFGRLVILICEDLASPDPARTIVVDAAPTLVVGLVMDGSLETGRWAFEAAKAIAAEPAALVLVANSWMLSERQRASGGLPTPPADPGVGIVCHPSDYAQSRVHSAPPGCGSHLRVDVSWDRWA